MRMKPNISLDCILFSDCYKFDLSDKINDCCVCKLNLGWLGDLALYFGMV